MKRKIKDEGDILAEQFDTLDFVYEPLSPDDIRLEIKRLHAMKAQAIENVIYADQRLNRLIDLSDKEVIDTPLGLRCEFKNGNFYMYFNNKLPRIGKIIDLESYQQMRNYYMDQLIRAIQANEFTPESPLSHALVHIKHTYHYHYQRDLDNYFRSFIFDALTATHFIQDDNTNVVKVVETEEKGAEDCVEVVLIDLETKTPYIRELVKKILQTVPDSVTQTKLF